MNCFAHLVVRAALGDDLLAAGELGGLAEAQRRCPADSSLSNALPTVGLEPQPEVVSRLAALGRDPELGDRALLALLLARLLDELARRLRGAHDRVVVAVPLDAEADDGLAGGGDAVDDLLGPPFLDADHDHGGDVRVAAGADQGAEVQVEVGAELQPPVRVRDRHRALDVVRHRLGGGVRQVVERQDDDVVAHADAAVLAPVAEKGGVSCARTAMLTTAWS